VPRRRKFIIVVLLGFAALALAEEAWSRWYVEVISYAFENRRYVSAGVIHGSVGIWSGDAESRFHFGLHFYHHVAGPPGDFASASGFVFARSPGYRSVGVPAWLVAAIFAGIAYAVGRRRVTERGMCSACGYDLRAEPQGGGKLLAVCPECGKETDGERG
jgi:hypothetical protein